MSSHVRNISFKAPANVLELVAVLIKVALNVPGGVKIEVSTNLVKAHAALMRRRGPDIAAAQLAAAMALGACMVNRILDDRPETGVVYTIANLLANAQSGRA